VCHDTIVLPLLAAVAGAQRLSFEVASVKRNTI
jgi:hypothetical protein